MGTSEEFSKKDDNDPIKAAGRMWLIDEISRAGLYIATPWHDLDVDFLVYTGSGYPTFVSRPIRVLTAAAVSFTVSQRWAAVPGLLIAYVWHLNDLAQTTAYALTYHEALSVSKLIGWPPIGSEGGRRHGASPRPGHALLDALAPYKMTSAAWWSKVLAATDTTTPRRHMGDSSGS